MHKLTYSHYDVTNKKAIILNFPIFLFKWNYKTFCICRVFEQLSCSIGWNFYALQPIWPRLPFARLDLSSKFRL